MGVRQADGGKAAGRVGCAVKEAWPWGSRTGRVEGGVERYR